MERKILYIVTPADNKDVADVFSKLSKDEYKEFVKDLEIIVDKAGKELIRIEDDIVCLHRTTFNLLGRFFTAIFHMKFTSTSAIVSLQEFHQISVDDFLDEINNRKHEKQGFGR